MATETLRVVLVSQALSFSTRILRCLMRSISFWRLDSDGFFITAEDRIRS